MTFEVPKDLVERVQILLRKDAGVDDSFRHSDPSVPPVNLPSVEEIIASFDKSPDDSRCEHCKGKLLRGVESIVCVYCGREQQKELPPQPISFTSTIGYRWLLDSLGLDGSEIVAPVNEGLQNNKKPRSNKDEVVLSEFLNLEIEWPVAFGRFGADDTDEAKIEGERPLHLVGVESDDSFSELKMENSSIFPPKHSISNEQNQSNEFKTFTEEEDSGFSGWEADFQPADRGAQPNRMDSSPTSQCQVAHPAMPKESVFKSSAPIQQSVVGTMAKNVAKDGVGPSNLSEDFADSSREKNHLKSHSMQSVENVTNIEDSSGSWDDFASVRNNQLPPIAINKSVASSGDVVSSDAWKDFSGVVAVPENQQQESRVEGPDKDSSDTWNDFSTPSEGRNVNASELTSASGDNYPLDAWNDFASFGSVKQNQQIISEGPVETDSQTDSLGLWSDLPNSERQDDKSKNWMVQSRDDTATKQGDPSFDLWDNFVAPTVHNVDEKSNNLKPSGIQMDGKSDHAVDPWGDFLSLPNPGHELNGNALDDKGINTDNGPFDPWSNFGISVMTPNDNKLIKSNIETAVVDYSKSTSQTTGSIEKPLDNNSVLEDDSFDSWSDFKTSNSAVDANPTSGTGLPTTAEKIAGTDFSYGTSGDFGSSGLPQSREHNNAADKTVNKMAVIDDPFSSWGGFGASSVESDQWQKGESKVTQDDFFSGWSSGISASGSGLGNDGDSDPNLKTSKNDNSFDAWSDFTSSENVQSNQLENRKGTKPGDKEALQVLSVPFDSWDMLISSSGASKSYQNGASGEHSSNPTFYSSAFNYHDAGLPSSLQPDLVTNIACDRSSSIQIAAGSSETPIIRNDAKIRYIGQDEAEDPASKDTSQKKAVEVEQLISQMPDLSFMLADSLSVPKKA